MDVAFLGIIGTLAFCWQPQYNIKVHLCPIIYIMLYQAFNEDTYYQVFLEELEENGITCNEYGKTPIRVAELKY